MGRLFPQLRCPVAVWAQGLWRQNLLILTGSCQLLKDTWLQFSPPAHSDISCTISYNRESGPPSLPALPSLQSLAVFFFLPCIDPSFTLLLVLDHQQPGHCSCLYFNLKWVASFLLATGCLAFFPSPSIKSDKCSFTEQRNQRSRSKRADNKLCAGCKLFYRGTA